MKLPKAVLLAVCALLVCAVSTHAQLYKMDAATMEEYTTKFTGGKAEGEHKLPDGWAFNLWDAASKGEFAIAKEPQSGNKALVLRSLEGRASAQFYIWKKPKLIQPI